MNIYERLENWWNFGPQERPCLIASRVKGNAPETDDLKKHWEDTDFIMQRINYITENSRFYGEAVPYHYVDYGASAMPGAMGAKMKYVDKETIWAYPVYDSIESVIDIKLNEAYPFYKRIIELTEKSSHMAKNEHHFVTPFALGGLCDNASAMYPCEDFLMDMIGKPEQVDKALHNMKNLWIEAFKRVTDIIKSSGNRGGIGWAGVWAPGTTFPVQEDVSYMFSNEMFKKYCLPHLYDIFSIIDYPMYHLDGKEAIKHLDCLLDIPELKVIQWVPGAGNWALKQWHDLIEKILSRGKSIQLYTTSADEIDEIVKKFGSQGLLFTVFPTTDDEFHKIIKKYGGGNCL